MNSLRAFFAGFMTLFPSSTPYQREASAPLVETVNVHGAATIDKKKPAAASKTAREMALRQAVERTIELYSPRNIDAWRLQRYKKYIGPRYSEFINDYESLRVAEKDKTHHVDVRAQVLVDPLTRAMARQGLLRAGKRFEFIVQHSVVQGGTSGNDFFLTHTVENNKFIAHRLGMATRFFWTDDFFNELDISLVTGPVKVATLVSGGGQRRRLELEQYNTLTLSTGFKLFQYKGFRANTSIGYSLISVRGDVIANLGGGGLKLENNNPSYWSWVFGLETQWLFSRRFGLGLRADYRPTPHIDLLLHTPISPWIFSAQLLVSLF